MRILHLSTSDVGGGAARAAYRLHSGLVALGQDSRMLVLRKLSDDPRVAAFVPENGRLARARRKLRRRRIWRDYDRYRDSIPPGQEPFSDDRTEHGAALARQIPECDIVNLHWIAGLLDHQSFFRTVPKRVPVLWRLADMAPLTGGCHYDNHCGRFAARCGACPQLGSDRQDDLSREIWQRRHDVLSQLRADQLNLVATSQWTAEQARRSSLLGRFPVTIIPNGLNTSDYAPRDRRFCRELWNIPADAHVVMFAAESLANQRKGLRYLVEALEAISDFPRLLLLSVGGNSSSTGLSSSIPHLALGRIDHDRTLSTIYSAADVFVIPSLQEAFGQTVIESLACGTPVIGFDAGGIPDMVRPGQTGWLCPTGNSAALGQTIRIALSDKVLREEMSPKCRRLVLSEHSLEAHAQAYVQLYQSLAGASNNAIEALAAQNDAAIGPVKMGA